MQHDSVIVPIRSVTITLSERAHPFEQRHADAVARHWAREQARNPSLYDGIVMLHSTMKVGDGSLETVANRVSFSTFLFWRDCQRDEDACHLFGSPMILSADGAMLLIRMADNTANAGRIYSPSGSLDDSDAADGMLDLEGNMRREVLEETGLDLVDAHAETGYHLYESEGVFALVRRYHFAESADDLMERIERHIAQQSDPEIDGVLAVRGVGDVTPAFQFYMPSLIAWHFAQDGGAKAANAGAVR